VAPVLSPRSRAEFAVLAAGPAGWADRGRLAPFLVGVHRRREAVEAHELAGLFEEAGVPDTERDGLAAYVAAAFHLLDAYDRSLERDDAVPDGTIGS